MTEEELLKEVVHSQLFDALSLFEVFEMVRELADLEWNDETQAIAESVHSRAEILLTKAWNFLKDGEYFE